MAVVQAHQGQVAITVGASAQPGAFTASQPTVCQGQSGVVYTVPNDPSVTYTWTYTGSGVTGYQGATTNSVSLNFSATATSGRLSVTATNSCGVSVPREMDITVNAIPGMH